LGKWQTSEENPSLFVVFLSFLVVFGRFRLFFVVGKSFSVVFGRWKIVSGCFVSLKINFLVGLSCLQRRHEAKILLSPGQRGKEARDSSTD
jgi:hypothetical protein